MLHQTDEQIPLRKIPWTIESRDQTAPYKYNLQYVARETDLSYLFSARENSTFERVMIKVDKKTGEDFQLAKSEANQIMNMSHPNIPRVKQVLENISLPNIPDSMPRNGFVMQYIEGKNLKEIFDESIKLGQSPNIPLLTDQLFQIADAIHYCNTQKQTTHRDIKPSNILIDNSNLRPYLIDFGIATSNVGESTVFAGTPTHASPQFSVGYLNKADSYTPTELDDVWGLGVIAYEMLSGKWPFDENPTKLGQAQVLSKIITNPHKSLMDQSPIKQSFKPELLIELDSIFNKVLQKDQLLRYQNPLDFTIDLSRVLAKADIHKIAWEQ